MNQLSIKISNIIQNIKASNFERKLVNTCSSFNTSSRFGLWEMIRLFKQMLKNKAQGDIVECGVQCGAYLIFFQKLIEEYNLENRKIFGYDTFQGIPEPTNFDIFTDGNSMKKRYEELKIDDSTSKWNYASLEEVKKNYFQNTSKNDNLITIKGKVENTLLIKDNIPNKIAILKLDTCLYEGVKITLETLYPRLQKGGILIVDNYLNFQGVQKATDEYFKFNSDLLSLNKLTKRMIIN